MKRFYDIYVRNEATLEWELRNTVKSERAAYAELRKYDVTREQAIFEPRETTSAARGLDL